jgi:sugar lactone lactonase YvrE
VRKAAHTGSTLDLVVRLLRRSLGRLARLYALPILAAAFLASAGGCMNCDDCTDGSSPRYPSKTAVSAASNISQPMPGCLVLVSGATGTNLQMPTGLSEDGSGHLIVADTYNNVIRQISPDGNVATIAGNGDAQLINGAAPKASFRGPVGVATGPYGEIFVADTLNHVIRKIDAGVVTTFAGSGQIGALDGGADKATFYNPTGIARDRQGNLIVSDLGSQTIRKVSPRGVVSTLAGSAQGGFVDGTGAIARFHSPGGVAVDGTGVVYVADSGNNAIRRISPYGEVTTLAGSGERGREDGKGRAASFSDPIDLTLDTQGNVLVLDRINQLIRKITPDGVVTSVASAPPDRMQYEFPYGIAVDKAGALYVAYNSGIVRKSLPGGEVLVIATPAASGLVDGPTGVSRLNAPTGLATDQNGNIYVADTENNVVRKILPDGRTEVLAGSGKPGHADGGSSEASFTRPEALVVDSKGNVYVSDSDLLRKISPSGIVSTVAGQAELNHSVGPKDSDGPGLKVSLAQMGGLAVDKHDYVYVAETGRERIRKISPEGYVTTVAGGQRFSLFGPFGYDDGAARSATFHSPKGIAVDESGTIFVADTMNHAIRKISPEGVVSTLAGGKAAYAAIREKEPIVGFYTPGGYADGHGGDAQFAYPIALALDAHGNLFVADEGNRAIRKVTPEGDVSTVLGNARGFETVLAGPPTNIGKPAGIALLPDGRLAISVPGAVLTTVGKAQCTAPAPRYPLP